MKTARTLRDMAALFLALGDGTRLRVLNLMRHGEICVSAFTDVLSQSQPKVSRHLAYLRNAGIVEARRDGKWMHYSLAAGLDDKTRLLLHELFNWMEDQDALQKDTKRYAATGHQTHFQAFLPLAIDALEQEPAPAKPKAPKRRAAPRRVEVEYEQPAIDLYDEPEPIREEYVSPRHNELEDFLL